MSLIDISKLTFAYDGSYDNIFENVSFQIDTDWKLGFIGRNGRGKTTFLNLLMGKYEYRGTITASVCFEYFPYPVEDKSRNTIDVVNVVGGDYPHWQLLREFAKFSVNEDVLSRPFATLSNGEQTKVLLAALFLKENSFLLIDEPTNHLDLQARELVAEYLKTKSGFILVSHDRTFLDTCVDHILCINKADIEIQQGNFSSWYRNKERQDAHELTENEKLGKEVKRLQKAAAEKAGWADREEKTKCATRNSGLRPDRGYIGHKAAKMMKRSKILEAHRQSAAEEKSKLLKNIEETEDLKLHPLAFHAKRLAECRDLSLFYGGKRVCGHVSFAIGQGERIALCGGNGSGKSSIIKLLCGEKSTFTGGFYRANGLKISYVPQDASHLSGPLADFERDNGLDVSLFRAILRKLDFSRVQFEKRMEDYSAGQRKEVLIARSLCEQAHLYVWDEPLNYIDVLSRIQIEKLLLEYRPTLLFVEHDRKFIENIATEIVRL